MDKITLKDLTILAVILAVSGAGPQIAATLTPPSRNLENRLERLESRLRDCLTQHED